MGNLTIASAFRRRNKLKAWIKKLIAKTDRADASKEAGTAENTAPFDGLNHLRRTIWCWKGDKASLLYIKEIFLFSSTHLS
jgi:hypothetical protein